MLKSKPPIILECVGALFGVMGTLFAAIASNLLFITFCCYAVSNTTLGIAAVRRNAHALLAMQVVYGLLTVVGLVRHFPGGVS